MNKSSRSIILLIIVIGITSIILGIIQNIASNEVQVHLGKYVWIIWPLLFVFTVTVISLNLLQYIIDQKGQRKNNLKHNELTEPIREDNFLYDAFISFSDKDIDWVRCNLVPKLEFAKLRVGLSCDIREPGIPIISSDEHGIINSKRTVVVLSTNYISDNLLDFQNTLAQTLGIQEGSYRLLPIKISQLDTSKIPKRINMLTSLDFTNSRESNIEFDRLVNALKSPLPYRR